jgi:hypothetical protein
MSFIKLQGNPSGTGIFTIVSPTTDIDRTLTLPDTTGTVVGTSNTATTLTNKTLGAGLVMAASVVTSTSAVATTSGTVVTIATGLPSWPIRVSVVLYNVSTNGTSVPLLQFGTGSTPTYVTTGYASGADTYTSNVGPVTASTAGFLLGRVSAAAYQFNVIYTFMRLSASANTWIGSMRGATSGSNTLTFGGGRITLDEPLTAIRLTTVGGANTFDLGSVNILYG